MAPTGDWLAGRPANCELLIVRSNLKRKVAVGAAALAAVAFGGGAYAATQTQTNPRQAFLNDVAKRLGVTPSKLRSALSAAALDQLQAAVKAGRLTQAQANAIKRRIQQGGVPPVGPMLGPPPLGHHRFFGPRALRRPGALQRRFNGHLAFGGPIGAGPIAAAAKYLGLSEAQLGKDLSAGKSLAELARAQHKSVSGLRSAIQAAVKARLDKAVSAGFLSKTQEQRVLSHMIPTIINRKIEKPGFGPRFRRFGGASPVPAPPGTVRPGVQVPAAPPAIVY